MSNSDYFDEEELFGMSTIEDIEFLYSAQDLYDDVLAFIEEAATTNDVDAGKALLNDVGKFLDKDPNEQTQEDLDELDDRYWALLGDLND